jgi:hypothetical protein
LAPVGLGWKPPAVPGLLYDTAADILSPGAG